MDAILISLFILSCYIMIKVGLRFYQVRRYLKQRRHRREMILIPAVGLRPSFSGHTDYPDVSMRAS